MTWSIRIVSAHDSNRRVDVSVTYGAEDVTIKVSDEGGGIAHKEVSQMYVSHAPWP